MNRKLARPINFVIDPSRNYLDVQRDIFRPIQSHLSSSEYSEKQNQLVAGAVNFSLFIRTPANVLLSHGVADKNYFWVSGNNGERLIERFGTVLVPGRWLRRRLCKSSRLSIDKSQSETASSSASRPGPSDRRKWP